MKGRLLWFLVPIAALLIVVVWWWQTSTPATPPRQNPVVTRPMAPPAPTEPSPAVVFRPPPAPPRSVETPTPVAPALPAANPNPVASAPAPAPKPDVAIEDGKTIDFSRGAPQVKDNANEQAIIARALKEMEEATKDVTFGPTAPKPDANKKAEPPVAPPSP